MTLMYIILFTFIFVSLFQYALEYINIKCLKEKGDQIPPEFEGHIDQETLTKTRNYSVEKNRIGLWSSLFGDLLTILFYFCGVLGLYASWVDGFKLNFIITGLIFVFILSYIKSILDIPFDLYTTFVIEKKFGFNTKSFKMWLTDGLKSLILGTLLTGILISAALGLISYFPDYWWLMVWILFLVFTIFMMYLSPYIIEPLFNKFTPLDDEELEKEIKALSEKAGITINRVFSMDASKRTKHTNAYFTGIGKVKRIVLYDTLIEKMDKEEILGVLAHEAGHWKKKHLLKMLFIYEIFALVTLYGASKLLKSDYLLNIFNLQLSEPFFAKVTILMFIFGIIMFPLTPLSSYFSRKHEREADDFALKLIGNGKGLISALVKLSKDNLSNLHPHPFYSAFYYSHPPATERIKYLNERRY
jgi:STE24 endopeptidase